MLIRLYTSLLLLGTLAFSSGWTAPPDKFWLEYNSSKDLTPAEAKSILDATTRIVDSDLSYAERRQALRNVHPHKSAVPALVMVIRNSENDLRLRHSAIRRLSYIEWKTTVPHLADTLRDSNLEIRLVAHEQLIYRCTATHMKIRWPKTSHPAVRLDRENVTGEEIESTIAWWKEWWRLNQKDFKLVRWPLTIMR